VQLLTRGREKGESLKGSVMSVAPVASRKGLLSGFRSKISSPRTSLSAAVLDEESFRLELVRERVRSERYCLGFVVLELNIVFGNDSNHSGLLGLKALCQAITERSRRSDVVGIHGNGVGLLLPETTREAVPGIVASIERQLHNYLRQYVGADHQLPDLECKVYYWPSPARAPQHLDM